MGSEEVVSNCEQLVMFQELRELPSPNSQVLNNMLHIKSRIWCSMPFAPPEMLPDTEFDIILTRVALWITKLPKELPIQCLRSYSK
jgi:hypothetical protein